MFFINVINPKRRKREITNAKEEQMVYLKGLMEEKKFDVENEMN